jgi:hypothetical protein
MVRGEMARGTRARVDREMDDIGIRFSDFGLPTSGFQFLKNKIHIRVKSI